MTNKNLQYKTNKQKKTTNTKLSLGYLYGNMLIKMFQTLHEISKNLICSGIMLCHNSSYYFKMYISEITKFPCQLHYYELASNL